MRGQSGILRFYWRRKIIRVLVVSAKKKSTVKVAPVRSQAATRSEISALIWSIADDVLRGVFKPHEYGQIILPFVVMRRLDCVLEPHVEEIRALLDKHGDAFDDPENLIYDQVNLPFFNKSGYDLAVLADDPDNIRQNFDAYIQGYSSNVRDILEHFEIKRFIDKLHQRGRLFQIVQKYTEIELHPAVVDNHMMGSIYEELLRLFSEMSNEESGDHFTPRDVVELIVALVFGGDKENLQSKDVTTVSVFDPCCGTGGMLTVGEKWVHTNIKKKLKMNLYGQELNSVTYAICKSDFLMLGKHTETIYGPGSSLSDDQTNRDYFQYMITNPPFGVSWAADKVVVQAEAAEPNGRFDAGLPRVSDGSLLFLQHMLHKQEPSGSRIGIVFNASPLFTGDAGSGESDIRKWIIENDWLECIVSLPDRMFFNTSIGTYIWILTNKKSPARKGKVQLVDGSSFHSTMKRNLGDKGKYISDAQIDQLFEIYDANKQGKFCKIFPNKFFGYTKVTVEQPLVEGDKMQTDSHGNPLPDVRKRGHERVPLGKSIDKYFEKEVTPHLPDAWMDKSKTKVGYEINFARCFYKFTPLRDLKIITSDIKSLDGEIQLLAEQL